MTIKGISRGNFLKTGFIVLGGTLNGFLPEWLVPDEWDSSIGIGRVTVDTINIYERPNFNSTRLSMLKRDELIWLLNEFPSPHGPAYNPIWYNTKLGYAHSGYLQRVENQRINPPLETIPENGILGEVTVPYTTSFRYTRLNDWFPLYRLYYQSTHWITGIEEGPDKRPWYQLTDHRLMVDYYVCASHLQPIPVEEYRPLSTHIPHEEKHIEVSIESQTLSAFEGNSLVRKFKISSGIRSKNLRDGDIPTDTPIGTFRLQTKMPSRHMGDGNLTSDINAYELPGVPWTMVFHETGVALHGTYWHNNFGVRMSHGCVNMRNQDAKWIFRWTHPIFEPHDYYVRERGTVIRVI